VQNEQHDNAPDALKDEHRNDQAKAGAAAGMVAAGSRQRQARRAGRREEAAAENQQKAAQSAWQNSYNSCMTQKGSPPPS
jgi:hypothetical protein